MGFKYLLKSEEMRKPNPDQMEVPGTEIKALKHTRKVLAGDDLGGMKDAVKKVYVNRFDKSFNLVLIQNIKGEEVEIEKWKGEGPAGAGKEKDEPKDKEKDDEAA